MRGEETDRVVAPVVVQVAVDQHVVVHELVHGHQFHGRDTQPLEMVDHHGVHEAHVGAADVGRDAGVAHRHGPHVRLVDHGLVVRDPQRPVVAPVEERVGDHRALGVGRRVEVVERAVVREPVGVQRLVPGDLAVDRLGVRVEEQLGGVAPVAAAGVVRAVHAVSVALPGHDPRQVTVPDQGLALGQVVTRLPAVVVVEQAQLDAFPHLREDREVRAATVVGRAERVGRSGPHVQ